MITKPEVIQSNNLISHFIDLILSILDREGFYTLVLTLERVHFHHLQLGDARLSWYRFAGGKKSLLETEYLFPEVPGEGGTPGGEDEEGDGEERSQSSSSPPPPPPSQVLLSPPQLGIKLTQGPLHLLVVLRTVSSTWSVEIY